MKIAKVDYGHTFNSQNTPHIAYIVSNLGENWETGPQINGWL